MDRREIDEAVSALPDREPAPTARADVANLDVATLLRHGEAPPSPRIWLRLAVAVGLAAVAVGAAIALWPRKPPREVAEMDFSVYLPPITTQRSSGGEETSPFTGFAVSIDTDPAGAVIAIGGVVRGEAPVLANVTCRGAEKVEVRADKPGFRPVRRQVACRPDTLVKLTLRLEP